MTFFLLSALAADLPPVEDVLPFREAATKGLVSMRGCHVVEAEVAQTLKFGVLGKEEQGYTVSGRLDQGVWGRLTTKSTAAEPYRIRLAFNRQGVPFVPPLLGEIPEDDGTEQAILTEILAIFSTEAEVEGVSPRNVDGRDVYRYERYLDTRRGLFGHTRDNHADVLFDPVTLAPFDWHVVTNIPTKLEGGGHIVELDAHIVVDAAGLPAREEIDATSAAGLFSLRSVRSIVYRVTGPCP